MIKVFLVLMITVFFAACDSSNSDNAVVETGVISSFENGSPKVERDYKVVDGNQLPFFEREYYADGNLLKEGALNNDAKRNGLWKSYYRDGVLWSQGDFINGIREGITITYFASGKKYYEGHYTKGRKSGVWKFWNEQVELVKETDYNN